MASSRLTPHMARLGRSDAHTRGRRGSPNSLHRSFSSNCTQRSPAALPRGIPGIGELMEGAVQHAPQ